MLLQVTAHLRPTCEKLIQLPVVIKHTYTLPGGPQEIKDDRKGDNSPKSQLLKTIKLTHDSGANMNL